jgi:hypothetical protein
VQIRVIVAGKGGDIVPKSRVFAAMVGAAVASAVATAFVAWRRDPRIGSGFVNRVVDPILVERGISGSGRSEIGTLEHVGRRSGIRRMTPVHPVPTPTGFRIVVPLGARSQWARNVLPAGHCRLQLHDVVHELDEPTLLEPGSVADLGPGARRMGAWLGFRYLHLRSFSHVAGTLGEPAPEVERVAEAPPLEPVPAAS